MTSICKFLILALAVSVTIFRTSFADPVWANAGVPHCTGIAKDTSGVLYATGLDGIWKSTNNGTTWQLITSDPGLADGFAIIVNPVTNDIIAAVEPGVYRSHDEGAIWTKLDDAVGGAYALAVRPDGLIIAAGSPGVMRSTNNGDSWANTSSTLGPLHNGITCSKTGVVFIASLLDGLIRSINDGISWQNVSGSFGAADNVQDVVADTANGYVYATAFHMFFNDPIYNKVFRSDNDGSTWTQVDSVGGISLSMGTDAQGRVFSGRTPTAYSTDHGTSWIDISTGILQGDRLVDFQAAGNGRMLVADMDDSLKFADFGVSYICGDADGGGTVDISDVVFLVNFIFAGGPMPNPMEAGDADSNGGVDISDAVYLVAFIFSGGPAPCSA